MNSEPQINRVRLHSRKFRVAICIAELIILAVSAIIGFAAEGNREKITIPVSSCKSDYIKYKNNSWYADESTVKTENSVELLHTPSIKMKKGSYNVTVFYEAESDQECIAKAESLKGNYVKERQLYEFCNAKLFKGSSAATFNVDVTRSVNDFEVVFMYNGKGSFRLSGVVAEPNSMGLRRCLVYLFAAFILIDVLLFCFDSVKKNKNVLLCIIGLTFLVSLPLFNTGFAVSHDLNFHLMRIEGLSDEIRMLHVPVKLSSVWVGGYGYPVSVYYGDLLLYFPAVLRIMGFPVLSAFKIYILMINAGTAAISYICFNKIFRNKAVALLTDAAYVTSSYRLTNIYVRSAVGEYSAMMFLPVVAFAIFGIYTSDSENRIEYRKNALRLAAGMTGLIGTHILSTEMTVIILALVFIVLFKKSFRKNTLRVYADSVLLTLLLNAYFIVPFVDYFFNVHVNVNNAVSQKIQHSGVYLNELFAFFRDINMSCISNTQNRWLLVSPGLLLMAAFIAAIPLCVNKKANKRTVFLFVFSAFTLFMATDLFPWDFLFDHFFLGKMMAQVQFPMRYIGIAAVFLSLLVGNTTKLICSINKNYLRKAICVGAGICIVMTCIFVGNYSDDAALLNYKNGSEIESKSVGCGEYIPDGVDIEKLSDCITKSGLKSADQVSRKGYTMVVHCQSTDKAGSFTVPMFNYKGYHATDDNGREYRISSGANSSIRVDVPADFDGNITVTFKQPWYWYIGYAVSLITLLYLCFSYTINKRKNNKNSGATKNDIYSSTVL